MLQGSSTNCESVFLFVNWWDLSNLRISGKIPCSNDWFIIKIKGFNKTLMFSLRVVIVILVGPIGFQLFNWNISFRTSSWVAELIISDFDKEWSRTLFKCLYLYRNC